MQIQKKKENRILSFPLTAQILSEYFTFTTLITSASNIMTLNVAYFIFDFMFIVFLLKYDMIKHSGRGIQV